MIKKVINNKKSLLIILVTIIIFPFIIMILNATIVTIFTFGEYVGTFLRHLYSLIVC